MPKLSDENNLTPLSGDFGMYYRGTYVCKEADDGTLNVMYVDRVDGAPGDNKLENVHLFGYVYSKGKELEGTHMWHASDVLAYQPYCGYYDMGGSNPTYISFMPENRTQKKALQSSRVLYNGIRKDIGLSNAYKLFNPKSFQGRYGRDLCEVKGNLLWKGENIGTIKDGNITLFKQYECVKELVCKLLARYLDIKSVTSE